MRCLLLTLIIAGCIGSASAQVRTAHSPALAADGGTSMKLQLGPEAVKVSTKNNEILVRSNARNPTDEASNPASSGWRTYGTLIATLVLMVAIAVRRHKSGKP